MAPPLQTAPTAKRIRAVLGGHIVLDSVGVLLVWEIPNYPQYYVPVSDLFAALEPTGTWAGAPGHIGTVQRYDVVAPDGTRAKDGAWSHPGHPVLDGRVRFDWAALDAWFEEDEEVFVHPRSPYVRVDALRSSRDVRIEVDGMTVARSTRTTLLFETGLRTRYYFPPTDVRLDLLRRSATTTWCPYKGEAHYHSVDIEGTVHDDLVWSYRAPFRESAPVAGLLCFYDERVDLRVDGVPMTRPDVRPDAEGRH